MDKEGLPARSPFSPDPVRDPGIGAAWLEAAQPRRERSRSRKRRSHSRPRRRSSGRRRERKRPRSSCQVNANSPTEVEPGLASSDLLYPDPEDSEDPAPGPSETDQEDLFTDSQLRQRLALQTFSLPPGRLFKHPPPKAERLPGPVKPGRISGAPIPPPVGLVSVRKPPPPPSPVPVSQQVNPPPPPVRPRPRQG